MAKLHYPVLDYKKSVDKFLDYANSYNNSKTSRKRLKQAHLLMFRRIVALICIVQYNNNKTFKDTPALRVIDSSEDYFFKTNNVVLSRVENFLPIHPKTAGRQISRLLDCGIISKKVNHGSKKNYDLFIKPEFLAFYDLAANVESQKTKSNEKQALQPPIGTKSSPKNNISLKKYNNLIIPVSITNRSGEDLNSNFLKNKKKNTTEYTDKPNTTLLNPRSLSITRRKIARPEKIELRKYQENTGEYFFNYLMGQLFSDRTNINIGNREKALEYVKENYFTKCISWKETDRLLKFLKKRVGKAKRHINRKKVDMQFIFPVQYLDLQRKGINPYTKRPYMSFINLALWAKKYEGFKRSDREKKRIAKETKEFEAIVQPYLDQPEIAQYKACIAKIQNKLPHLLDTFLQGITKNKCA